MSNSKQNFILTAGILLLSMTALTSCATTKEVNKQSSNTTMTKHLTVSFYSPGNGINEKAKAVYDAFLKEKYSELKFETIYWGREGEVDYCFQNIAMFEKERVIFVKETKKLLAKFGKINITENEPCRAGRK